MKKGISISKIAIISITVIIGIFFILVFSKTKLHTYNPIRALIGYIQVVKFDKEYVEVCNFPTKTIYANSNFDIQMYMKERGYKKLEELTIKSGDDTYTNGIYNVCIYKYYRRGINIYEWKEKYASNNEKENNQEYYYINNEQNNDIDIVKNTVIIGKVELNHNGYIYTFNGQHFGEFGFEMDEYTMANINNKNQKCIDYITSKEYDTSYIKEGDLLICTGDLSKKATGNNNFDTKDNPIIVLKSNDYNKMIKETLNNQREYVLTIGDYFEGSEQIYLKYNIWDKTYELPFVIQANISKDTKIIGELKPGDKVKVKYKNLEDNEFNKFELDSIED